MFLERSAADGTTWKVTLATHGDRRNSKQTVGRVQQECLLYWPIRCLRRVGVGKVLDFTSRRPHLHPDAIARMLGQRWPQFATLYGRQATKTAVKLGLTDEEDRAKVLRQGLRP